MHFCLLVFCFLFPLLFFPFNLLDFQALEEEIDNQAMAVAQVVSIGHSLALLSCRAEQASLAEKLDLLESRYTEVSDRCGRKAALLDQALSNARLFGEDEVEVLNWLAELEDKLSLVSIKDYRREVLQQQHSGQLVLIRFSPSFMIVFILLPCSC